MSAPKALRARNGVRARAKACVNAQHSLLRLIAGLPGHGRSAVRQALARRPPERFRIKEPVLVLSPSCWAGSICVDFERILPARQLKPTHGPPGDLRTAGRPAGPHPSRSARPLEAGRGRGPCFRKPARRPRERGGSGRGPWEGDGPDAPDAMSSNARLARPRFCECAHTLLRARKAFGAINRAAATSRKASARQPGACRADSDG